MDRPYDNIVEELKDASYSLPHQGLGEWTDPPNNVCTRAAKEIAGLRESLKKSMQNVERYGEHEEDCLYGKYVPIRDMPCTCGFLEAIGR